MYTVLQLQFCVTVTTVVATDFNALSQYICVFFTVFEIKYNLLIH